MTQRNKIFKFCEYFHVAPWSAIKSIQKNGILVSCKKRGIFADSKQSRVYLFKDEYTAEDALVNWLSDYYKEDYAAIIKVEIPCVDVHLDPELAGAFYVFYNIKPSLIRHIKKIRL